MKWLKMYEFHRKILHYMLFEKNRYYFPQNIFQNRRYPISKYFSDFSKKNGTFFPLVYYT